MATTWNAWGVKAEITAAEKLEKWLKGVLAVNRVMESMLIDVIAAYTPWLAPLIPASIAFDNVQRVLHFAPWQAWLYAAVVECLGLATVATTLRLWNWMQDNQDNRRSAFALAVVTALFYLVIVLGVNVLLDDGDWLVKLVKALASTFSVVGALTVAIRSHQAHVELTAESATRQAEKTLADEHQQRLLEEQSKLETLRLEAQERQKEREAERNFRKEIKLAELQLKLAEKVSAKVPESGESFGKVAGSENDFPETFGKWDDWRNLPDEHKKRIAGLRPRQVRAEYGVPEKTSGNWVRKAVGLYGTAPAQV